MAVRLEPPKQQELAKRIFQKLAEAEAKVHGSNDRKVHFHEVGAVDSIADIGGVRDRFRFAGLRADCVLANSDGPIGVEIAHGRCSIPAPATGELLHVRARWRRSMWKAN